MKAFSGYKNSFFSSSSKSSKLFSNRIYLMNSISNDRCIFHFIPHVRCIISMKNIEFIEMHM